ncbi:MAG: YCF48-related protein [Pseudomonadota bacterium]
MTKYLNNLIGKLLWAMAATAAAGAVAHAASTPRPAELAPRAVQAQINDLAVAGDSLIAVGERGIILRTQDGKKWTQVASPVDVMLNAVTFADDRHGWAVGHDASILHTADGGRSWSVQAYGGNGDGNPFLDVFFTDPSTGYAVGGYGLFKLTEDGGKTWTDLVDPALSEGGMHMNDMLRLGDGTFVLVGEMGLVASSADARAWTILDPPYEGSLYAALPLGQRGLLVIGMRGNAFQTEDLSAPQWQAVPTGTEKPLFGLARLDNGRIAVAGSGGTVMVLEAGKEPSRLEPPAGSGVTLATTFGALLVWKDHLYAASDSGVHRIATLR